MKLLSLLSTKVVLEVHSRSSGSKVASCLAQVALRAALLALETSVIELHCSIPCTVPPPIERNKLPGGGGGGIGTLFAVGTREQRFWQCRLPAEPTRQSKTPGGSKRLADSGNPFVRKARPCPSSWPGSFERGKQKTRDGQNGSEPKEVDLEKATHFRGTCVKTMDQNSFVAIPHKLTTITGPLSFPVLKPKWISLSLSRSLSGCLFVCLSVCLSLCLSPFSLSLPVSPAHRMAKSADPSRPSKKSSLHSSCQWIRLAWKNLRLRKTGLARFIPPNLVAADPCKKFLTFWGCGHRPDFPKS